LGCCFCCYCYCCRYYRISTILHSGVRNAWDDHACCVAHLPYNSYYCYYHSHNERSCHLPNPRWPRPSKIKLKKQNKRKHYLENCIRNVEIH
jgi:hypothetical protein